MEIRLTIPGNPITKKNSQNIIRVKRKGGGTRPVPLPSEQYMQYREDFLRLVPATAKCQISTPINLRCVYYMARRRACDLVNLLEATQDILVDAGVLEDDNRDIVASVDGSRVCYDKDNPRVEITITDLEGYETWSSGKLKKSHKKHGIFAGYGTQIRSIDTSKARNYVRIYKNIIDNYSIST